MADFMTVLAASQKQIPTGGNALAALLPEGLFESVLSAQIEAVAEGEALLPPPALAEEFTLLGKPAAKKPPLSAVADADQAVELPLAPVALNNPLEASKPAPAPGARPALSRTALEAAATPAASMSRQGQDLPLAEPLPAAAEGQAAALPEVAEALLPQAAVSVPGELAKPLDQSAVASARQLGQFGQLELRAAETRVLAAVETPVRSQGFPAEFSEKIVWLVGRQSQVADLSLNPPQLGALEVRLSLSGSEAGAQFYSPHPVVREAIEAALPRLRELLAQAGIALGDAQVRDEAFARRDAGGSPRAGAEPAADAALASLAPMGSARAGLGLVDLYV